MKRLFLVFLTVLTVNMGYAATSTDSLSFYDKADELTDELLRAGVGANMFEQGTKDINDCCCSSSSGLYQ